jgi:hypothetical protein
MLDELFRDDPRTIRYGAGEILHGYSEIKSFRSARSPVALGRGVAHHYRRSAAVAVASTFERPSAPKEKWRRCRPGSNFGGWRVVAAHVSLMDKPAAGDAATACAIDQQSFLHEAVIIGRIRRVGAARKHFRKFAWPVFHELGYPASAQGRLWTGRYFPIRSDRFQRRLDIREGLHALGVEIAVVDKLAVAVDANLAGDEDKFRRLDS